MTVPVGVTGVGPESVTVTVHVTVVLYGTRIGEQAIVVAVGLPYFTLAAAPVELAWVAVTA